MNEFVNGSPSPRRGFTSIEATAFLRGEFPNIPTWICWDPEDVCGRSGDLRQICGRGYQTEGTVGNWSWRRIPTSYPELSYWGETSKTHSGSAWVGAIEIAGDKKEKFILFSCLCSTGYVGRFYMASTEDLQVLEQFAKDLEIHFRHQQPQDKINIRVYGGRSLSLTAPTLEEIVLSDEMRGDIEQQVLSFFENPQIYKQLGLPHRRGLLFVGAPGTGKTMMLRHLIRLCHQRFKPLFAMLSIRRDTSEEVVAQLFRDASESAPSMVVLEDMDSLMNQARITRSSFLAQLDGVASAEGMLIIGTTNNAAEIDPALIHRPSRFDRVWHFALPDHQLRHRYLASVFKTIDAGTLEALARQTTNWSFAYLKELHTTAAIMSAEQGMEEITHDITLDALNLLSAQFQAGRSSHQSAPTHTPVVGFAGVEK